MLLLACELQFRKNAAKMSGRLNDHHTLTASNMSQATSGKSAISQLKRFGRAKAKINSIYEEILGYGCDVAKFLNSFTDDNAGDNRGDHGYNSNELHIIPDDCADRAEHYNRQLEAISGVLKRDHMKVSTFKWRSSTFSVYSISIYRLSFSAAPAMARARPSMHSLVNAFYLLALVTPHPASYKSKALQSLPKDTFWLKILKNASLFSP